MSLVKQKIIDVLDFMSDEDAEAALNMLKQNFVFTMKKPYWEDVEIIEPDSDTIDIIEKIKNTEGYHEYV